MLWIELVRLTWLEIWQSRSYRIMLVLALLAPALGIVLGSLFMVDIGKVYVDAIAASSQVLAMVYFIFLVVTMMSRDIFDRICYMLLTPPVTRMDYYIGRFVGFQMGFVALLLLLLLSSAIVGLLYIGEKPAFYQSGFSPWLLAWMVFFHFVQYISILGVIFFIVSWSSGNVETMLFSIAVLLFAWVFPPVLKAMQNPDVASDTPGGVVLLLQWVYEVLPHLQGAEISLSLAHGVAISLADTLLYVAEHVLYALVCFILGLLIFQRRDL